jgi:uncharacterized repeat protein (TIGR03803 family)
VRRLSSWKTACAVCLFSAATAVASPAQTFKTLANFDGTNGSGPLGILVQGADGNFYGTTVGGGTSDNCPGGCGTIFEIDPRGNLTTLHSLDSTDGEEPQVGLALATDRNFYGTTSNGGASNNCQSGCGTVFKITPKGKLTTLHNFDNSDGANPYAALVQGADGNFYGTTENGGANCAPNGCGTVFEITARGKLTTLYSFCDETTCNEVGGPANGLVQATNGDFYGTTAVWGRDCAPQGCGTVFRMTPGGTLTTLQSFDDIDGANPYTVLVQATDGNFYGTTQYGGDNLGECGGQGCGTVFRITPTGKLTTLYSFCSETNCADGLYASALLQATDGNFYGTTEAGGSSSSNCPTDGCGTIFKITPGGKLTTLHSFEGYPIDGSLPVAGLVQGTDGTFYGTTSNGRVDCLGCGTVFSLSVGLGPFVETVPTSGAVGATVTILGNNLTGATSLNFNGTPAVFTVVSRSEIKTAVPAGATTGKIEVKTPEKTIKSNLLFRVRP